MTEKVGFTFSINRLSFFFIFLFLSPVKNSPRIINSIFSSTSTVDNLLHKKQVHVMEIGEICLDQDNLEFNESFYY